MSTVQVEYVGKKPEETDCLYGTGLTWVGLGSKHDVPLEAWEKMLAHPDVWRLADSPAEVEMLGLSDAKPIREDVFGLDAMEDAELLLFAEQNHIKVHHKQRGDSLRAVIAKSLNSKE